MSVDLVYDFSDNAHIQKLLASLSDLDLADLASAIAHEGENQTKRRLEHEKTSPAGEPWPELTDWYQSIKQGSGGLLEGEGDLIKSIRGEGDGHVAEWGTNLAYARIHNEGGEIRPKNAKRLAIGGGDNVVFAQLVKIPQREYLGLSSENKGDIDHLVMDFVASVTGVPA